MLTGSPLIIGQMSCRKRFPKKLLKSPPTDAKGLSLDPELEPNVNPPDPELVLELEPELELELDPEPNNPNNPPEPEPNINPPLGRFVVVGAVVVVVVVEVMDCAAGLAEVRLSQNGLKPLFHGH